MKLFMIIPSPPRPLLLLTVGTAFEARRNQNIVVVKHERETRSLDEFRVGLIGLQ